MERGLNAFVGIGWLFILRAKELISIPKFPQIFIAGFAVYRFLLLLCFIFCLSATAQSNLPRRPNIDEVATVLRAHLGSPPEGFISYFWPDEENALLYVDVNGDGEEDLIANGWLFVAIFLWRGDSYSEAFQLIETANTDSGAWSNVAFVDYTLDNSPEIVFDLRLPYTGNSSGGNRFERSIIHCESHCAIVWEAPIAEYFWVNSSEIGMYLYESEMQSYEENGQIWMELIRQDFAFNCRLSACRVSQEQASADLYEPRSRVGAVIKQRFLWDASRFVLLETITLVDSYPLVPSSQLSASYSDKQAVIEIGERCQILVNDAPLGESFACLLDFSRIEWRDLTGDGIPELLLEYAYFDSETLLIYSIEGREIGRITGVIREADLFGIRITENGILSAGNRYSASCEFCWYEFNQESQFYQWTGFSFQAIGE